MTRMDVTTATDLARRICELFGVDMDLCAGITVELMPVEPIKVHFTMVAGEALQRIDWEEHLRSADQVVKVE